MAHTTNQTNRRGDNFVLFALNAALALILVGVLTCALITEVIR